MSEWISCCYWISDLENSPPKSQQICLSHKAFIVSFIIAAEIFNGLSWAFMDITISATNRFMNLS